MLVFLRAFISSLAFYWSNLLYSIITLSFLIIWILLKRPSLKNARPLLKPIIFLAFILGLSSVFSFNPFKSIGQLYTYLIYILMFFVVSTLSADEKKEVVRAITLAGMIISFLAIYQCLLGFRHVLNYLARYKMTYDFGYDYLLRRRAFFPFVTPNALGGFLIMIVPFVLDKKKLHILIPVSIAILFTQSIGAFLSLFAGLVLYFYLRGGLKGNRFLGVTFMAVIIFVIFILRSQVSREFLQPYSSLTKRIEYWKEAIRIIGYEPVLGMGFGNFNMRLSRYAHNLFLQIWAEMGLLGLLTFIWLIVKYFTNVISKLKKAGVESTQGKNQTIALLCASFVFLFHNIFDFTFFLPEICLYWWVILGLSLNRDS